MKGVSVSLRVAVLALMPALASPARADTVTDWNTIMQSVVAVAPTNANYQARWGAIVQVAVFDAVNSIVGDYEPYVGVAGAPAWASPDAAAIAAAHRTLVTLRPLQEQTLNGLRAQALSAIPDGPAKEAGILVGEQAAATILMLRANDGWNATVPYTPGTNPGNWQPAPPANAPAFLPGWGLVTPFCLEAPWQFRAPAPPALHTGKYANDVEEVKLLGRVDSPYRPQDRTDVARFYAANSPTQAWNPAARQVSAAQGRSLSENARIFALLNMAMCDGSIASYDTKYYYNLWRPLTAIRNGDLDGNRFTEADPAWLPLIPTPAFPSYASGHATLSGAARAVLEETLGKGGHDVTLVSATLGVELNYTTWKQITDDIDDARIYGGIHFRFDQEVGARQGKHVGHHILENYLLPLP
jgi:hypothetical protein